MKSDVCYLYKGKGQEAVLKEVEKTAIYCELEHKEKLQLRLLAEELTGHDDRNCRGLQGTLLDRG